ncbi:MAG: hypothetical protein MJK04_25850, partial [Psychrosphaera sp.]|nr:hypothetical protein [Psychrosphaera sp.]
MRKNRSTNVFTRLLMFIGLFLPLMLYAAVPSTPSTPSDGGIRYHAINSNFNIIWNKHSNASYYLLNGSNVGNVTSKSHSYSSYGWRGFRVQACNSEGCSGKSNSRNVYVYTAPGPVQNLTASASSTKVGNSVSLSWSGPGGGVPGVSYNVVINGARSTTTATSATVTINAAGSNSISVNACNPSNVGCGSSRSTTVIGIIDPPGKASAISISSNYQPVNRNVSI